MYSATDPAYLQARLIKRGERSLPPRHQALVDWIGERVGVKVLDFSLEARGTAAGYRQQVVLVNVERSADAKRLGEETAGLRLIAQRFHAYVQEGHDAAGDPTKTSVHPFVNGVFPEVIVGVCALEDIEAKIANAKVSVAAIQQRFADVSSITTNNGTDHTVWFDTDEQLGQAQASGLTEAIADAFVAALKPYDAFGYFGRHSVHVTFDTRQNLTENFGGQEWMYYR